MSFLIDAVQLDKWRKQPKNVVVLDASWHLPASSRDGQQEYLKEHIVGARFFDIASFFDITHPAPHMQSIDTAFVAEKLSDLGITPQDKIIIYDQSDCHTSCRAWWMLCLAGHPKQQIYLLNGGYDAWKRYGGKVETGEPRFSKAAAPYPIVWQWPLRRALDDMKRNVKEPTEQVLDARHPVRFAGGVEPRPGLRQGHIPGSYCFPYLSVFEKNGEFRSMTKLRILLRGIGLSLDHPIVTTCGSGMTAAILNVVLELLEVPHHALYDGSFAEWGSTDLFDGETNLSSRPVVTSVD